MQRVKWVGIGTLVLAAMSLFLAGCKSKPPAGEKVLPKVVSQNEDQSKEVLFRLYQRQEYEECLKAIEKIKDPKLPKDDQAELALMEALCHEEMNEPEEADHLYRTVIEQFGHTPSAERAARRLAKQESDQTEHFTIDFAPGGWKRLDKQWNSLNLRERYISTNDSRQTIIVLAKDLGPARGSVAAAVGQVKSVLRADAEQLEFKTIDESSQGAYFEFTAQNPGRVTRENVEGEIEFGMKMRRSAGVGRLVLTSKRMNVVIYSKASSALEKEEKEKWLEALKKARLVRGTAQSIKGSSQQSLISPKE